ncbi:TIR domain-containing protein [Chitinophaga oryzae]|uniref:TIR domain-containing protein n=1 Tax=Chitinophaga oryzae TaxID=2725414 RepID=A0AAE6ZE11_9BACT|nr:TIR domain-containing protein [Chitinophaga oryzae]QJB29897.1 TIR domain-containing protein [Chitinophaga oryzae]
MSLEEEVKKIIGFPEGNKLRYEALLPSTNEMGGIISGFANTEGGILVLGILSKNRKITVTGLSTDFNVELVLNNAMNKVVPKPLFDSGYIDHKGKKLFVLKVDKAATEIAYDQIVYTMKGKDILKKNKDLNNDLRLNKASMKMEEKLDRILAYLSTYPQLINVNKNTIKVTILDDTVTLFEAEELLDKLKMSGFVKVYADRYIGYSLEADSFLSSGGYSGKKQFTYTTMKKSIFISYNWAHKTTVQKLFSFLTDSGFSVKMDDHSLSYKDHISSFMESIRDSNFAVLIISDEYLRSANCMTEVLHILKDRDCQKKILPIRHENAKFFKTSDRLAYVSYWNSQVKDIEEQLKSIEATSAIDEIKKLKIAKNISQEINSFLSTLSDMITNTIEEQEEVSYKGIIDYIKSH